VRETKFQSNSFFFLKFESNLKANNYHYFEDKDYFKDIEDRDHQKKFIVFFLQINIFLVFLDNFNVLISKIIFKNYKILF